MNSLRLDANKMDRCKRSLLEDYFRSSIVGKAVDATDYVEESHRDLPLLEHGRWVYVPKEWFTDPSVYPDIAFSDIGRGIAFGENKYIVQQILTNREVNRIDLNNISYKNLKAIVDELISLHKRNSNLVLFVPIEYFVKAHVDWAKEQGQMVVRNDNLLVDNSRLKIFWSNKYVDFSEFIVAWKSSCRFVAKPNVKNRLQVELHESRIEPENMELKAWITFNFTIIDPQGIKVVRPTLTTNGSS